MTLRTTTIRTVVLTLAGMLALGVTAGAQDDAPSASDEPTDVIAAPAFEWQRTTSTTIWPLVKMYAMAT